MDLGTAALFASILGPSAASLLGGLFGGGGGGKSQFAGLQKRLYGTQADAAELALEQAKQRMANEKQYMGPALASAFNNYAFRNNQGRDVLWGKGAFEPKFDAARKPAMDFMSPNAFVGVGEPPPAPPPAPPPNEPTNTPWADLPTYGDVNGAPDATVPRTTVPWDAAAAGFGWVEDAIKAGFGWNDPGAKSMSPDEYDPGLPPIGVGESTATPWDQLERDIADSTYGNPNEPYTNPYGDAAEKQGDTLPSKPPTDTDEGSTKPPGHDLQRTLSQLEDYLSRMAKRSGIDLGSMGANADTGYQPGATDPMTDPMRNLQPPTNVSSTGQTGGVSRPGLTLDELQDYQGSVPVADPFGTGGGLPPIGGEGPNLPASVEEATLKKYDRLIEEGYAVPVADSWRALNPGDAPDDTQFFQGRDGRIYRVFTGVEKAGENGLATPEDLERAAEIAQALGDGQRSKELLDRAARLRRSKELPRGVGGGVYVPPEVYDEILDGMLADTPTPEEVNPDFTPRPEEEKRSASPVKRRR